MLFEAEHPPNGFAKDFNADGHVTSTVSAMSTSVIIVAAGGGRRFGGPKQFEDLSGLPVLEHALLACLDSGFEIGSLVAVLPAKHLNYEVQARRLQGIRLVAGGASRSGSVRAGLAYASTEFVLVHDGARPLASPRVFERVRNALHAGAEAVVPAIPVVDSIRNLRGGVVDRDKLRAVQTPQGFRTRVLAEALESGESASDEATLVERAGSAVTLVDGEPTNVKITYPHDIVVATTILNMTELGQHAQAGLRDFEERQ